MNVNCNVCGATFDHSVTGIDWHNEKFLCFACNGQGYDITHRGQLTLHGRPYRTYDSAVASFNAPRIAQAPAQLSHASDPESGTSWVRGMAKLVIGLSLPALLPPVTAFGVAALIFGGLLLAFSPTMARAEDHCYQETYRQAHVDHNGIGLWAFIRGVLIGALLIVLAGAVAILFGLALLHGGA